MHKHASISYFRIWRDIRTTDMDTSAEHERKAAYSDGLRWRIVRLKLSKELSYQKVAKNLCVSLGTVHNAKAWPHQEKDQARSYPSLLDAKRPFLAEITTFHVDQLVWIVESGCKYKDNI